MSAYLLDTSTFIWAMLEPDKLSRASTEILEDAGQEIWVSVVSLWEIEIKVAIGKLTAIRNLKELLDRDLKFTQFRILNLERGHIHVLPKLPLHHKDPFDRMLIAQAIHEDLTLIATDAKFAQYEVPLLW